MIKGTPPAIQPGLRKKGKKISGVLHLWLGLVSGLVVFIVSLTGCLFVFNQEISSLLHHEVLYIQKPAVDKPLSLTQLKETADKKLGGASFYVTTYPDKTHAWEFMLYEPGNQDAFWFFNTIKSYKSVFINPYTGRITGEIDYKKDFFIVVKYLHWSLLLNTKYGQPIVGYSTLIFVILLITGLVLWWPKNLKKANFDKSFKISWRARFKRLNYDLHNVPGFYAMLLSLILALTGMVWAMKWFQATVYVLASQSLSPPATEVLVSDSTVTAIQSPLDLAYYKAKQRFPHAGKLSVSPPAGSTGVITISAYKDKGAYYGADALTFDQYTGKLIGTKNFKDKNAGEKLLDMNYDIHVGAILGLPGKIIAFIASLIAASLPVTGFMIWWGRRNKKKSKAAKGIRHYISRKRSTSYTLSGY